MTGSVVEDPITEALWPAFADALLTARSVAEEARNIYGDLLDSVWMYGSRARGNHRPDLDLLLVTTSREADPRNHLQRRLRRKLTRQYWDSYLWVYISVHAAYSEQLKEWDTMFYRNVRADAVRVM